jgi:polyribonucleotide nucleotidyltransferase
MINIFRSSIHIITDQGPSGSRENEFLRLQIIRDEIGRIIGSKGALISSLEEQTATKIEIDKTEGTVEIRGRDIHVAKDRILQEVSWCKVRITIVIEFIECYFRILTYPISIHHDSFLFIIRNIIHPYK